MKIWKSFANLLTKIVDYTKEEKTQKKLRQIKKILRQIQRFSAKQAERMEGPPPLKTKRRKKKEKTMHDEDWSIFD